MNLSVPLLVTEYKRPDAAAPMFSVRPLFVPEPFEEGEQLSRVVSKISGLLRKQLEKLGSKLNHAELIDWTFNPTLEEYRLKTRLHLRRGTADVNVLVIVFEALDRKLAMMPVVSHKCFEILRGQTALDRAAQVLTEVLNKQAKLQEKFAVPERFTALHKQWTSSVDVEIGLSPRLEDSSEDLLAMLGGPSKMVGRDELYSVGRCLDTLWPADLQRATKRDAEVSELVTLLAAADRRPVLLLGPTRVGKTAVLHDCVHRRVSVKRNAHSTRRNVWLLSPQRLISGMMYVGQWESRVTAIVEEAIARDHVLYFDDVLGLYAAGKTQDADLTVADVLKPYVERREFRMLAEMTPEAFRVLQEKDRGLADQFHILRITPTIESQTREILFNVRREMEGRHRARFGLDVLPPCSISPTATCAKRCRRANRHSFSATWRRSTRSRPSAASRCWRSFASAAGCRCSFSTTASA